MTHMISNLPFPDELTQARNALSDARDDLIGLRWELAQADCRRTFLLEALCASLTVNGILAALIIGWWILR